MARAPHERNSSCSFDLFGQSLGALDLKDDGSSRSAGENLAGEEDQKLIPPDDVTTLVNNTQAIAIAIISHPQVSLFLQHLGDQICQVCRHGGVGVVIGKSAVHVTV